MKLVSLNTWGAAQDQVFYDYIIGLAPSTDIFCFQEVYSGGQGAPKTHNKSHMFGYEELKELLPDFSPFFAAKSFGYPDDELSRASWSVNHGLAMFVRNTCKIINYEDKIVADSVVYGAPPLEGQVKVQIVQLGNSGRYLNVVNMHGMSRPGEKLDTPERLEQSRQLVNILKALPKYPTILCGDFNLMPETQSIVMIESVLENLIKKFGITNTRNQISWAKYQNRQSFADFTFTSAELKIKTFEVPYNEVSDHLPMILEFDI